MALKAKTVALDPHRIDLDRLEFDITELLNERNTEVLSQTEDKEIVHQFIDSLLGTAEPLTSLQFKPIADQLFPLADDAMKEKIRQCLQRHTWSNRWNNYKIVFALVVSILLCLVIYLVSN